MNCTIYFDIIRNAHVQYTMPSYVQAIKIANGKYTIRRSQWPLGLKRESTGARLLGIWFRNSPDIWMSVPCKYCVFSGRCLCDGPITRPEESYCMHMCLNEWNRGMLYSRPRITRPEESYCMHMCLNEWNRGMLYSRPEPRPRPTNAVQP
jgi:hypothetical protein